MGQQSNTGKYKVYADSVILYGPSGVGQNLNEDLQGNLGNELDAIFGEGYGSAVVSGWVVTAGAGLSVDIAAGTGYVAGQRLKSTGAGAVSGLPSSTTDIKIYVEAASGFNATNRAWPPAFGYTIGSLNSDQLLLAEVDTDGSNVIAVRDKRVFLEGQPAIAGSIDDTVTPAASATSLRQRLGMLARRLKDIIGAAGNSWLDAIPASLTAIWGKFHASTGHVHSGGTADAPQIPLTSLDTDVATQAELDTKMDGTTGHRHTGGAGDAPDLTQYLKTGETRRIFVETFYLDPTSPPTPALAGYTPVLDFAQSPAQYVYCVIPIPPEMDVAQASKLIARITASTSVAGTAIIAGDYVVAKDGESVTGIGTAFSITATPNATAGLRTSHDLVTIAADTLENTPTSGAPDTLTVRLYRNGGTHTGNMRLITIEFEYVTRRGQ